MLDYASFQDPARSRPIFIHVGEETLTNRMMPEGNEPPTSEAVVTPPGRNSASGSLPSPHQPPPTLPSHHRVGAAGRRIHSFPGALIIPVPFLPCLLLTLQYCKFA